MGATRSLYIDEELVLVQSCHDEKGDMIDFHVPDLRGCNRMIFPYGPRIAPNTQTMSLLVAQGRTSTWCRCWPKGMVPTGDMCYTAEVCATSSCEFNLHHDMPWIGHCSVAQEISPTT